MILVGTVLGVVPQSYLVPPLFQLVGQLQAKSFAGCPTVQPKYPTRVCERSVDVYTRFAHACYLFSLYMRE